MACASLKMSCGIVAEKMRFWRFGGRREMIFWTSGRKPMSIMRSASSSTSISSAPKSMRPW
ncbi:MAG: hypothetical protein A3D28_01730 [Omnitrophica bacterium RIFCSPHIGHO2_02_FULL_63_14]|nr:MAG: hypothetical protein A3D28_01730 [Omnitrophica bacterium RIFCSPHIGHO2_02_FULL_63_14]